MLQPWYAGRQGQVAEHRGWDPEDFLGEEGWSKASGGWGLGRESIVTGNRGLVHGVST